jgi:hypothetical protein
MEKESQREAKPFLKTSFPLSFSRRGGIKGVRLIKRLIHSLTCGYLKGGQSHAG